MGTFKSIRKAYGALKDSTTVSLAKVNSEFKDLDIAVVKATNHVEAPPKERHVRRIFAATSVLQPRADVAYCIHALARRLAKTKNWIVAVKVLIVIHRTLREGDPAFREELLAYSHRGQILKILSNFKDDSSPLGWDCSAWIRYYALFIEERLECFRVLKYDIEAEKMTKSTSGASKVHCRTRLLNTDELLEQLPALQQLLFRLMVCQPEGSASCNYLIQYALALVLKESFKIYCALNDGIINLVDMFFDMNKNDAERALSIYRRAGQQAEYLSEFYEFSKRLDLARNFQFPTLRQPPPSFLATMEEYVKEAPQNDSFTSRTEYEEMDESSFRSEQPEYEEIQEEEEEEEEEREEEPLPEPEPEPEPEPQPELPPLISTDDDLLGLHESNPKASELEERNALALAIIPSGGQNQSTPRNALTEFDGTSGWELALVTQPSNINNTPPPDTKLAGGFDNLLLNSLYEDENARRQLQLQNAGYGPYGMGGGAMQTHNPYEQQHDPFLMSTNFAPPTNVQLAMYQQQQLMMHQQQQQLLMNQQQQLMMHQQMMLQPQHYQPQISQSMMMVSHQNSSPTQYPQVQPQQHVGMGSSNPFGDPFAPLVQNTTHSGNHSLL